MKTTFLYFSAISLFFSIVSCEKSSSDEFFDNNGDVKRKLVKTLSITSAQNSSEDKVINLSFDNNYRLNSITDGMQTSVFVYDNNELITITGQNDNLNIEELYNSPYDAFETGEVLQYDSKGNPIKILFKEERYNGNTGNYEIFDYTADISYDSEHNPYFYTLQAGGLIDVMDNVRFNFSPNPQSQEIVIARTLLPVNNPSKLVYKNESGEIVSQITVDYSYDNDNYPSSATVTVVSFESNNTSTYNTIFTYLIP